MYAPLREFRVFLRAKDNLGQPFAISQIDENDAAMVARNYPAGERDVPADIGLAKRIAMVSAIHGFSRTGEVE